MQFEKVAGVMVFPHVLYYNAFLNKSRLVHDISNDVADSVVKDTPVARSNKVGAFGTIYVVVFSVKEQ